MKAVFLILITTLMIIWLGACKKDGNSTPPQLTVPFVNTDLTDRFIPFGVELSPGRDNPAYEIILTDPDQNVVASCGGTIGWIYLNDNFPDYEIEVIPFKNSRYRVIYDHIKDPVVSQGQHINAGDVLGKIGAGIRAELQINDVRTGKAVCPLQFSSSAFIGAFDQARGMTNAHYGTTYSSTCIKDEVVP